MKMKDIKILQDVMCIENDRYKGGGDYSVTEIIDPPRLVRLKKKYKEQIVTTIDSATDSLMGTAMHALIERNLRAYGAIDPHYLLEERLTADFTTRGETRALSGQYDILYKEKYMTDVKTAKVWKLTFDPDLKSWTQQQNIYACLSRMNGMPIETISVLMVFKDWSVAQAMRTANYPKEPIELRELTMWSDAEQKEFIEDRLAMHVACESMEDENLPDCTSEERWERFPSGQPVQYAVLKNEFAKRATKILSATNIANAVIEAKDVKGITESSIIEIRHAERKRCEKYCAVCDFCHPHQEYMKRKKNNQMNEHYPLKGVV
jgi:hypothetical protein